MGFLAGCEISSNIAWKGSPVLKRWYFAVLYPNLLIVPSKETPVMGERLSTQQTFTVPHLIVGMGLEKPQGTHACKIWRNSRREELPIRGSVFLLVPNSEVQTVMAKQWSSGAMPNTDAP